ncbi:hypothetical protein BpHYR1_012667 [Brachionus plicatilis]|uniref:Uncharacterized protein n=1 Tax=Brachionus plicatilis TaxID=10195 RepID=A0A3M7Q5J3_BRAPC|nr:hypothetical protein BpHYR1_012667 [Brachionus plicatilis]
MQFFDDENHNVAKCPAKESLCGKCHQKGHMTHKCTIAKKLKSIERQIIDYSELYIEQEEIQTNFDENVDEMPKTRENQPNVSNDQFSLALLLSSAQILKTPVLEDHLNSLQIPVQPLVPTSIQNVQKDRKKTKIKRPKKAVSRSADEDDDTFESEMTISTEHHAEQSTNPERKCSMITYAVTQQPASPYNESNIYFDFKNYVSITKPRNKYGRGVVILVKEGIEFIQDFSFDEFSSEILSIKLNYGKNDQFYVFSLYDPPNVLLNFDLFEKINISSSVTNKINEFRVLSNQDMISDHFPIETSIAFDYIITVKSLSKKLKGEAACGPDLIHNLIKQDE